MRGGRERASAGALTTRTTRRDSSTNRTRGASSPRIQRSVGAGPDGLLRHENVFYSLFPPHVGMRQYWRDFESLERWARADPHRGWWSELLADSGGTGFWHETYPCVVASRGSIST
jgi:hypothetical protein